jgi:hypothetical protein
MKRVEIAIQILDRATTDQPPLLPEGIGELSCDPGWKRRLFGDTVVSGQLVFRHPECPEQKVPHREGAGEIGIAALLQ